MTRLFGRPIPHMLTIIPNNGNVNVKGENKAMAKEIVAMILAGGRGSRLYALTQKTAKPAVSFGGKYRIVDFPLSNCVNSNIDTVGIATQYQPQKLNEYIGNGQPWDLDRLHGGVHTLRPTSRQRAPTGTRALQTPSTRTSASSTATIPSM